MQRGYVLAFRPVSGQGAIITDLGDTFQFTTIDLPDLRGGDIVSFHAGQGSPQEALDLHLIQRWPEAMPRNEQTLAGELYRTVELGERIH